MKFEHPYGFRVITKDVLESSNARDAIIAVENSEVVRDAIFDMCGSDEYGYPSGFLIEIILEEKFGLFDSVMENIAGSRSNSRQLAEALYTTLNRIATEPKIRWYVSQRGVTTDMLNDPKVWNELITGKHRRAEKRNSPDKPKSSEVHNKGQAEPAAASGGAAPSEDKMRHGLDELIGLIGLQAVKQDVNSLINTIRVQNIRRQRGMKTADMSLHLVLSGNPGTGKTTVARLLGEIYRGLGVLSKGHLVEVDRSGLVAGYVGQTALKTQEVIERSLGGILFIDEAYSLSNPGLKSRFNKFITFDDYSGDELFSIFHRFLSKNDYIITEEADAVVRSRLGLLYERRE